MPPIRWRQPVLRIDSRAANTAAELPQRKTNDSRYARGRWGQVDAERGMRNSGPATGERADPKHPHVLGVGHARCAAQLETLEEGSDLLFNYQPGSRSV